MDNATTILGWKSEPQPDGLLRVLPECGGRTANERGFVHGPPELVVEVSKATRYVDLGPKLNDYERAGVLEYVVRTFDPDELYWFGQEHGTFVRRTAGDDGLYRSTVFPGLWLDPAALLTGETRSAPCRDRPGLCRARASCLRRRPGCRTKLFLITSAARTRSEVRLCLV